MVPINKKILQKLVCGVTSAASLNVVIIVVLSFIIGTQIIVWSSSIGEYGFVGILKGFIVAVLSMVVGALIVYAVLDKKVIAVKNQNLNQNLNQDFKSKWEAILSNLIADENILYGEILDNDGKMLQKDLIEKTGFSNAKVTRVLDALEDRKLVERKRHGMSNMVFLI